MLGKQLGDVRRHGGTPFEIGGDLLADMTAQFRGGTCLDCSAPAADGLRRHPKRPAKRLCALLACFLEEQPEDVAARKGAY